METVNNYGCLGNTIKVHSGGYFDLLNPTPEMVDFDSIAHGLSMNVRFTGQCPEFYSVAEHSIHAVNLAIEDGVKDRRVLFAILLHDASEAYTGDMSKPLKNLLPEYKRIEDRITAVIGEAFGIDFEKHHDVIKHYDRMMLKAEKQHFWPDDAAKWTGFGGTEDRKVPIKCRAPFEAKSLFCMKSLDIVCDVPITCCGMTLEQWMGDSDA